LTCGDDKEVVLVQKGLEPKLILKDFVVFGSKVSGDSDPGDCVGNLGNLRKGVTCSVSDLKFSFSSGGFAGLQLEIEKPGQPYSTSKSCKFD
jgi:hypothetical protein